MEGLGAERVREVHSWWVAAGSRWPAILRPLRIGWVAQRQQRAMLGLNSRISVDSAASESTIMVNQSACSGSPRWPIMVSAPGGANQGSQRVQIPSDWPRPIQVVVAGKWLSVRLPQTQPDARFVTGGQGVAGSNPAVPTVFRTLGALTGNQVGTIMVGCPERGQQGVQTGCPVDSPDANPARPRPTRLGNNVRPGQGLHKDTRPGPIPCGRPFCTDVRCPSSGGTGEAAGDWGEAPPGNSRSQPSARAAIPHHPSLAQRLPSPAAARSGPARRPGTRDRQY